jgi:hypothetical protein
LLSELVIRTPRSFKNRPDLFLPFSGTKFSSFPLSVRFYPFLFTYLPEIAFIFSIPSILSKSQLVQAAGTRRRWAQPQFKFI